MPSLLIPATAAASALVAAAGTAAYGALSFESQLFGPSVVSPPSPNQLAITFDDGPNPVYTPRLLELLARHNVHATFFLIGRYVRREPALTRDLLAAGHTLGNHTMQHLWLPRHSGRTIRRDMYECKQTLEDTLGQSVQLFRPPHGARRPAVFRAARALNLQVVMWNLMVGDWKDRTPDDLYHRICRGMAANRKRNRGTQLVLHDGSQHSPSANRAATIEALRMLLQTLSCETRLVTPPQWQQ